MSVVRSSMVVKTKKEQAAVVVANMAARRPRNAWERSSFVKLAEALSDPPAKEYRPISP
jgi:hypothetical protein